MKLCSVILAFLAAFFLSFDAAARPPSKYIKILRLNGERTVVLKGGVTANSADHVVQQLVALDTSSSEPIYFVINSTGGIVPDGFRLAAAMEATQSRLICVVDTRAYSMAAILTQYCDRKYMQKYATIMFHQASFGVGGSESLVASRYKHTMSYLIGLHKQIAIKLNMPYGRYRSLIANEWWMTAEGALRAGVVDGIVTGLKYEYAQPAIVPSFGFNNDHKDDILMCGPTSDTEDVCYGVYK